MKIFSFRLESFLQFSNCIARDNFKIPFLRLSLFVGLSVCYIRLSSVAFTDDLKATCRLCCSLARSIKSYFICQPLSGHSGECVDKLMVGTTAEETESQSNPFLT